MSPASPAALVPLRGRQEQARVSTVRKQRANNACIPCKRSGLGDFLKRRWVARWQQRLGSNAFKYTQEGIIMGCEQTGLVEGRRVEQEPRNAANYQILPGTT